MNKQNNQNIQGRTDTRTDQQILEKHTGVQEKVRGYMKRGKLRRIIAILSAFVLLFTLNSLKFRADTLQRIAMCGLEEHTHTEACYNEAGELVCGRTEHEHTDACYQQRPVQPEPTVFDEFKDLNSQVVLASPMEEDVSVSSDSVDETVGETTMDLDADSADEGIDAEAVTDEGGLEVEYDLDDLYGEDGDEATIVDDYVENDAADAGNDADQTVAEYSLNGGSVAFLSDVLRATGLEVSGITAVGEIADDAFVDTHIAVEPVEGVDGEYVLKVTESFDRVQLGVATADAIETVWLTDGQAVAAVYDEAQTSDETVVAEEAAEPAEPAEEIVEQTEETFNSNETIETEQKQTEVGEIETEVGMDADVSGDQDASSDEENRVEAEAAPIENDESVTEDAADASDVQGVEDAAGDNAVAENEDAADAAVGEDASSDEDEQAGEDAADATVGEDASSDEDEQAAVVADRKVSLDFTNYIVDDAHTVYLYDAEMRAVLVNTAEIETVDGVVVTTAEEEAANEAADEAAEDESGEESEETGADEGGVLIIEGDGEYALNGTAYVVTGLVLPEAVVEETQGAEQSGDEIQDAEAPAEEAQADEETAVGDQSADDAQDEAAPAEKTVALDFTDYIATDDHAVFLYDASMVAVLVNEAEIASADGVTVTLPEEAAEETDEALADAEEDAEAPAEEAADDAQAGEGALIITGDGEYALNGTTYVVTGLVLPEKAVGNDNITIATTNDEATLLNVAPVFEETDEDYDDIFSLFTAAKDDPTLLARVVDLLGGVAYAEEVERDLNVKVFRIGLEDVTTGEAVEPGTELHVETSLDAPIEGEEFQLYHIENGKAELIPDAVVVEDGQAVGLNFNTVSLDKFALVYYTVNVVVEEKNITIDVDFTDVVENGVDFDSQAILTALNDGVAIDVASLLAGETGDSLIVEASATADVDVENLEATAAEGGVTYADGAIKVTGDGAITLTDSVYTIIINVTNYQTLVEKELKADGVTVEVIDGEVPAGSTVTYEALSDAHTEALVEEYIPEAVPASAEAKAAASGEEEADSASAEETVEEQPQEAAEEAAEAPSDATDESVEEKSEEKIETATGYTAFDVSIAMPEGDEFTKEGQFAVTVDHAVDAASLVPEGAVIDNITYELFHIHNGEATQIEDVAVADGQVSFTTDGFSEYVIRYTVDFEVEGNQGEITLNFTAFDATTLPGEGAICYNTEDCSIHVALGLLADIVNNEAEAGYDIDVNAALVDNYEFDFAKAEMGKADSGIRFADGELVIEADGFVELTEGERMLRVRATGLTALKQALLEAENVSIEVVSGNVPLGSEASYTAHTDEETAELVENYINNEENGDSAVAGYSAADLKIVREGEDLPVEGQFKVTVEKSSLVPAGMKLEKLYHIHKNENEEAVVEPLEVNETEEGLVFELTGFSDIVASYTVEFYNGDYMVVIPGGSQVLLSTLIDRLSLARPTGEAINVDEVASVEFETPELFSVLEVLESPVSVNDEEVELTTAHDFLITSLKPFDEDQMILTLTDGAVILVKVTDAIQDTLTTVVKFFAKDAKICEKGEDVEHSDWEKHIVGLLEAPELTKHYYVRAILKDSSGKELGWSVLPVDLNGHETTQVSINEFYPFETQGDDESDADYHARRGADTTSETLAYHANQGETIETRLFRADAALSSETYRALADDQTAVDDPEDGYEFGGNFMGDNQNQIHIKKANDKRYKVRVNLDSSAESDIGSGEGYYVYVEITHASGGTSYQYAPLVITAEDRTRGYVEYDFSQFLDSNGDPKKPKDGNCAFTGNEARIDVSIMYFTGTFNPANKANAMTITEGSAIKDYRVTYDTKAVNPQSSETGYHETQSQETIDGKVKTIVTCTDYIDLATIDAEGQYNYASVLGPNLIYGIVADHLYHETHLQTNFAVNHYTGHGPDTRPDLSGKSSGGSIVIAQYNYQASDYVRGDVRNGIADVVHEVDSAGQLNVGAPLNGNLVAYVDSNSGSPTPIDPNGDSGKVRGNYTNVTVIQTDGAELSRDIVEPALRYGDNMSAELASHPATFDPPIPSQGKLTLDTTAFPTDATIFIDASRIMDFIKEAGQLEIRKHDDQMIVFNFTEEVGINQDITLAQFKVYQESIPEGFSTWSPEAKDTIENEYMEMVARHIVWNLYNVKGLTNLKTGGGIFLQPNENSEINIAGTTAGWIVSEGLVYNGSGEWHNVFSEMPETSSVKLHAFKKVDDKQPRVSQKFQFFLDKYDTTVEGNWNRLQTKYNSTGSIEFDEIKGLDVGWHVFRISENPQKPSSTHGLYSMDRQPYYALVRVQNIDGKKVVNTPMYFTAFNPDAFNASSAAATGVSADDRVNMITFENREAVEGLSILKEVQGSTDSTREFTFEIELWRYYNNDTSTETATVEAATYNVVTSTGTEQLTVTNDLDGKKSRATITVKAGDVKTIQGLPSGTFYKITETKVGDNVISTETYVDGYKARTAPQTGSMETDDAVVVVTFNNEYKAETKAQIVAHKVLEGRTLTGDEFTFELREGSATGAVVGTQKTNAADGTVAFDVIDYKIDYSDSENIVDDMADATDNGDGTREKVFTYYICEVVPDPAEEGMIYAEPVQVQLKVVDDGQGNLTVCEADGTPLTDNGETYSLPQAKDIVNTLKAEQTFTGTKVLTGRDMEEGEFLFDAVLTSYNDGSEVTAYATDEAREAVDFVIPTRVQGTNAAATADENVSTSAITFPDITFTKVGTYTFTVTEDKTRLPEDVEPTRANQSYDVTIVVTESKDSVTGKKILVAGEPTYTNDKTINNTQKKMGFTVTKEWFNAEGTQVFDGHTITFSVTKDGEAFPVTDGHIEKVGTSSTDGSYTVNSDGTVTLTAGTEAWPTVRLKELVYPTTGYAVSETAHTGEADGNFVNTTYRLNAGDYQATSPAVKVNDDALKIKNNETNTGLHVTKKWVASDGETDISKTVDQDVIYFAIKYDQYGAGYYTERQYNYALDNMKTEGLDGNKGDRVTDLNATDDTGNGRVVKIFSISRGTDGKWGTVAIEKLHNSPLGWGSNGLSYSIVEIEQNASGQWQEVTSGVSYAINGINGSGIEIDTATGDIAVSSQGRMVITNRIDDGIEVKKVWSGNFTSSEKTATVQLKRIKSAARNATISWYSPDYTERSQGTASDYIGKTPQGTWTTAANGSTLHVGDKVKISGAFYDKVVYGKYVGLKDLAVSQPNGTITFEISGSEVMLQIHGGGNYTLEVTEAVQVDNSGNAADPENEGDPVILNADNGWYYRWTGLSDNYSYYVVETGISTGINVAYTYNGDTVPIGGITKGLITVTNTKTEEQLGSLKLTKKVTVNGQAPVSSQYGLVDGEYTFTVASGADINPAVSKTVVITVTNGVAASATVDDAAVTLSEGFVVLNDLKPGSYTVTEKAPTNGTKISEINGESSKSYSAEVTVTAGNTSVASVTFTNDRETAKLTVEKRWLLNGVPTSAPKQFDGTTIESIQFDLYQKKAGDETGTKIDTYTLAPNAEVDKNWKTEIEVPKTVWNGTGNVDVSYYIVETTALDHYATTIKSGSVEVSNASPLIVDGKMTVTITNSLYTVSLPATGGPGTSMFYVFGSIITLLAAVLLITKRRSGSAE